MGNGSGARSKKYRGSHSSTRSSTSGGHYQRRAAASTTAHKEAAREAARQAVQKVIKREVVVCSHLWEQLGEELTRCFEQWDAAEGSNSRSQEVTQARAALRAALMISNSAHLAVGIHRAKDLGMPVGKANEGLRNTLDALLAKEDSEGTWRCLASALAEQDYVALTIWLEEAKSKELDVPAEVHDFYSYEFKQQTQRSDWRRPSSRDDEVASGDGNLGDAYLQELADAHALEAYNARDEHALRRLIAEAHRRSLDPSLAQAVLLSLEGDRCDAVDGTRAAQKNSKQSASGTQPADDDEDFELEALRNWGCRALKEELTKLGVELRGAYEKEELVQMVQNAHREKRKQRRRKSKDVRTERREEKSEDKRADRERRSSSRGRPSAGASDGSKQGSAAGPSTNVDGSAGASASTDGKPPPQAPTRVGNSMSRGAALECLGLDGTGTDLTTEELRRAYKKAALRWHPDRQCNHGKEDEAKQRFQDVRTAYELLSAAMPS